MSYADRQPGGPRPYRTIHELIEAIAALEKLEAESVENASGIVVAPLTPDEEQRLREHADLIAMCAARCDAMLGRRAFAREKANPTLRYVNMFVWRAEQVLFHRWLVERLKLTQRDVNRIAIAQGYQQHQYDRAKHHQRPSTRGVDTDAFAASVLSGETKLTPHREATA
ncbi:MAG TPA: hypothetical protein VHM19_22850 [Polyangiales bacterium]|jgi:hypothetical protein|nr:hypothetical protein [Polyangiales bacterium]